MVIFPNRDLLELRFGECPGIGNYKRSRIFREISHKSNMVTANTGISGGLEILENTLNSCIPCSVDKCRISLHCAKDPLAKLVYFFDW